MLLRSALLAALVTATLACSSADVSDLSPAAPASSSNAGATTDAGGGVPGPGPSTGDGGALTKSDAGTPPAPGTTSTGSGGTGGPGAGEHDVTFQGSTVALHVPASVAKPTPILVLLHGQGDTGRNFLNVWLARGYPADVVIAAPDDNTDTMTDALETRLRAMYDVDTAREYLVGFSQGGAYAAFVLFDPSIANRFAAVGLVSAGLAQDPSGIPAATKASPAIAVVIDPEDPNNTWNQGLHVMEDFVTSMSGRGYDAKLWLHHQGHTISAPEVGTATTWMLGHTK